MFLDELFVADIDKTGEFKSRKKMKLMAHIPVCVSLRLEKVWPLVYLCIRGILYDEDIFVAVFFFFNVAEKRRHVAMAVSGSGIYQPSQIAVSDIKMSLFGFGIR